LCGMKRYVQPSRTGRICKNCHNRKISKRGKDSNFFKHGLWTSSEWASWQAMRARCLNPKHTCFKLYGGRGITICKRWNSFKAFLADMGPKPSTLHTL